MNILYTSSKCMYWLNHPKERYSSLIFNPVLGGSTIMRCKEESRVALVLYPGSPP